MGGADRSRWTCPACGGREVGRVGNDRFFCWECCVEFSRTRRGVNVYQLDHEGCLTLLPGEGDGENLSG